MRISAHKEIHSHRGTNDDHKRANPTLWQALRVTGETQLAELDEVARAYLDGRDDFEPIARKELLRGIKEGRVVLIDVRPRDAMNWAREGWQREQQALQTLGGTAWLAGWESRAAERREPVPLTEEEIRRESAANPVPLGGSESLAYILFTLVLLLWEALS